MFPTIIDISENSIPEVHSLHIIESYSKTVFDTCMYYLVMTIQNFLNNSKLTSFNSIWSLSNGVWQVREKVFAFSLELTVSGEKIIKIINLVYLKVNKLWNSLHNMYMSIQEKLKMVHLTERHCQVKWINHSFWLKYEKRYFVFLETVYIEVW